MQSGKSGVCQNEGFGQGSGFVDEVFEEGELGREEEGVVVG